MNQSDHGISATIRKIIPNKCKQSEYPLQSTCINQYASPLEDDLRVIIISLILNILRTRRDTSIFHFAKKKALGVCILGEHDEPIRPSLHSMHQEKKENAHILDSIGDHQA